MKKTGLGKLYDRLTPEERFRLHVEAKARGDEEESRRLTHTCSQRTYTMNDRGHAVRWQATIGLTKTVLLDLTQCIAQLRMIAAFRVTQPYARTLSQEVVDWAYFDGHRAGSRYAWRMAGMTGDPPGLEEDDDEEAEKNADLSTGGDLEAIETRVEKLEEVLDARPGGGSRGSYA